MRRVNFPKAGCPPTISDRAKKRKVRKATKTLVTTLKELQSSDKTGDTVDTTFSGFFTILSFMGERHKESHF